MPNLLTHYYNAEDILKMTNAKISASIQNNIQAYWVGSSGPDILFYYNQLPWQSNKKYGKVVRNYGSLLHKFKINDFYRIAVDVIIHQPEGDVKDAMIAFVYGHLAHWSLDMKSHPYIFYNTDATTEATKYWHFRFESMIDTMMARVVKKESIHNHPLKELLKSNDVIEEAVTKVYQPVFQECFDLKINKSLISKCFKDAQTVLSILHDPTGRKFKFIYAIEKNILKDPWFFSSHIVTDFVDDDHDIFNEAQNEWFHPCDHHYVSQKSFIELYDESVLQGLEIFSLFAESLDQKRSDKMLEYIDNRSYETGLSEYKEMKYYKSIYK